MKGNFYNYFSLHDRVNNMRKVSKNGTLSLNEKQMLATYYCVHCHYQWIFFL